MTSTQHRTAEEHERPSGEVTVQAGPTPIAKIAEADPVDTSIDSVEDLRAALIAVATIDPNAISSVRRTELHRALVEVRPRIDDMIRWLAVEGS